MGNLSEESKDLLRDMLHSEAWRIYEALQQEQISNLRVMATRQQVKLEDRLWYSAMAQGREDSITNINDLQHANSKQEASRDR